MATSKEQVKASYPLPVYNYQVTVQGVSLACSEVSGIQLEHEHEVYRHGLSFLEGEEITTYKIDKYVPVTFKAGVVQDRTALYEWLHAQELRTVAVSLCDEEGQPIVSWRIAKAVPTKIEAPSFSADSNDVAVESLEVMGTGITLEHL